MKGRRRLQGWTRATSLHCSQQNLPGSQSWLSLAKCDRPRKNEGLRLAAREAMGHYQEGNGPQRQVALVVLQEGGVAPPPSSSDAPSLLTRI